VRNKAFDPLVPEPSSSEPRVWNGIAEGWHRWIPRMREWYAPATRLMLDLARIGPGNRVLDVAAGDGDQSLAAARRVGSSGYVLATDPARELLAFVQRSAEQAGVENLEIRIMKAENLELPAGSFDAVICRFGLKFFSDRDQGLQEMNRVLNEKGRVSLVVYGADGSPEFSLALSTVRRRLGISEHGPAAADSLGDPGVLKQLLERAGFGELEVHAMTCSIHMASAAECVRYLQDTSPTLRETLSSRTPDERKEDWKEIEQALSRYQGPAAFEVDHRILIAAGTRV
jgi:ubiquinone/menaquinone biosynthesis C-methylase UbiE